MKKFIAMILAVLMMAACFAGCSSEGTTLEDIQKAGKLTVASSPDFPPFESLDENGEIYGIEIDILNIVCEELGVELVVEEIDFESVLTGVQAGKYNAGASGITVTPDRQENMLFTDPYCMAAQAIVVLKDSPITCKADLEGKTVSVQTATTAEEYCMENGYNVSAFTANADAQEALIAGKVDAWVIDDLTAAEMVSLYNEENGEVLVVLDEAMTTEPYAFAFAMGSDDLVAKVTEIINGLVADGTVADIFAKYEAPYTAPSAE